MRRYTASNSDIVAWLGDENPCPLRYWFKRHGVKREQPTLYEVVGDGTHEAATADTPAERAEIVKKHTERLPEEQREEAQRLIVAQVKVADQHEKEQPIQEQEREKLERWLIPGTNWELVIKSDRIGWFDFRGQRVLQISDLKSGLNPEYVIYHLEFEIQEARRQLTKRSENLRSVEEQLRKARLEAVEGTPNYKSATRRVEYLEGVREKVSAQVAEFDMNVRMIARKLKRLSRKLERIRTQLYFFAMVASKTRNYDKSIRLQAEFLGNADEAELGVNNSLKAKVSPTGGALRGDDEPDPNLLVFWYQPDVGRKALAYYTNLLVETIQPAHEKDDFPPNPGFHCRGCEFKDSCKAHLAWEEKRAQLVQLNVKPNQGETPKSA